MTEGAKRTKKGPGSAFGTMRLSVANVECYAGYKADQRPLRFRFVAESEPASNGSDVSGARTYEVAEVLDRWYGPDYECFKVRADDGNLYVLRHELGQDTWSLDSFRRDAASH